jgi:hypothetical protein
MHEITINIAQNSLFIDTHIEKMPEFFSFLKFNIARPPLSYGCPVARELSHHQNPRGRRTLLSAVNQTAVACISLDHKFYAHWRHTAHN